jgi:hypothetical protein
MQPRDTFRRLLVLGVLCALPLACAPDRSPYIFNLDSGGIDVVDESLVGRPDTAVPIREGGTVDASACSESAQLVYVLSDSNVLYSFRPNRREFMRIGPLRCPTSMQPNSMAIDRDAVAWVNYVESDDLFGDSAGSIYRVSTVDATCTSAAPIPLRSGWYRMGMGFSTLGADSIDETLFVTGISGSAGLGRVDRSSLSVVPIGAFAGALRGQSAELTGTGDGRLYGFFTTSPPQVAGIEKSTAGIMDARPMTGLETPSAWAFSFWGGDFYLYTAPSETLYPTRTSNVTRFRPSTGEIDTSYMTNVGFRIVGAGVSTCAPILPPP